jgi:hypothetical protein
MVNIKIRRHTQYKTKITEEVTISRFSFFKIMAKTPPNQLKSYKGCMLLWITA